MILKVEGIILSETPYKETSKIINVLTKNHGMIGMICKGAKSLKSNLRATTQLYTYGYFYIYYKQADTYLIGPGYKLHVDYWVPFDGGIGFHDAYWRYDFGGDIYKTNGSHGCINMQNDAAKTLFENVEANTRVLVHK